MTTHLEDDEPDETGGRPLRPVPPLPPDDDDGELDELVGTQASSYEVELDDEPDGEVGPVHEGDGYKLPLIRGDRRAIIPKHMRSVQGVRRATWRAMDPAIYNIAYYGLRVFRYVPLAHFWAVVGLVELANAQRAWWWVSEQTVLRQLAVVSGASAEWRSLFSVALKTRSYRGLVLLGELIAVAAVLVPLRLLAPWWGWAIFDVAAVVPLAWYGQPASHPIITPSMIKPRHRKINADIVLRACYRAKLGDPDPEKPDEHIEFAAPGLHRDGDGSRVTIDLPYGRTFDQVMKVRKMLASGLDVSMNQLFLYADPSSERRFSMWIADTDPLATPAGPTPLLDLKPRNIWKALPFGLDQRGAKVLISLMWTSFLIGAQPRKGKALALDTVVPTPGGWTTMGELRRGDMVFDEAGRPCRVVEAWPVRHDRPCYEVEFSDGSVIVADAEHLWQVDTRASRLSAQQRAARVPCARSSLRRDQSHRWARSQVLTTADMADSVRIQGDSRANYSVRVAAPIQAPHADLPVSPYTLGAWLGDGTSREAAVSCRDDEIIDRIRLEGHRVEVTPSSIRDGRCPTYRIYGIQDRLRRLGVLNNKHIPTAYLRASEDQRRALLAGLLDTDGYCQDTGVVYFAVTCERLARDVRHLVSTLGYKSTINVKPVKLDGRDLGQQWVVTFTPPDKVFGLARKATRQVTAVKASAAHRFITAIRPVPSVPVRCITVDSPSSLYLVGETCIPTHNTWAARIIALFAALDPYVRLVVVDGKNAPDWIMFTKVAHRFVSGTHPTADGDPVTKLLAVLNEVKRHIEGVNEFLKTLPAVERPEGKLTEALSRKYAQLRVWVLVLEEFQLYFELEDQAKNKEVAGLLNFIKAVGPSAGVIVVSSSQKPSGVGAGDVQRLFNRFRDNHDVRFALKCGNRIVSEAILGGDAYSEGLDASALPLGEKYRGVGILYGLTDDSPTLRTFRANDIEAEKIVDAALRHRQRLGLLTGDAIAEELDPDEMNILADVVAVFGDDVDLQWEMLAGRLREVIPERHANMNGETISAAMRKEGIASVDVRFPKTRDGIKLKGCRRLDVSQRLAEAEIGVAAP